MDMKEKQIAERKAFLKVYSDFNNWLCSLGFKSKMSSTIADYHYSFYNDFVDGFYGVECYLHEDAGVTIRFLRDSQEHKFLTLDGLPKTTETIGISSMKEAIITTVRKRREELQKSIDSLPNY